MYDVGLRVGGCAIVTFALAGAPPSQEPIGASRIDVLDFEGFAAGAVVDVAFGRHGAGPVGVRGTNPELGAPNAALAFDSSQPTGGDFDLGTPNESFGGPGVGQGGEAGSPFENRRPLGNLLIVGDDLTDSDGDGLVDNPGDASVPGATLELDFAAVGPVSVRSLTVVDLESRSEPSIALLLDGEGSVLHEVLLPVVGDNGVARVELGDVPGVSSMRVVLNGSSAIDEVLFELPSRGSIAGRVWDDLNGNGLEDPEEPGLAGVTLELADSRSIGRGSVKTGLDGAYAFDGLPAGTYVVTVLERSLPSGYAPSECDVGDDDSIDSDCSPATVELAAERDVTDLDFGYGLDSGCAGSIGDFVFQDLDGDHLQDPEEPGIAGATLRLYDPEGALLQTVVSDSNGSYLFDGLCPGVYEVTIDIGTASFPGAGGVAFGPVICDVGLDDQIDSECGPVCVELGPLEPGVESIVSLDFGFAECGSCDGKVDALSLRFLGGQAAFIEVVESDGALVFAGEVAPLGAFSFFGMGFPHGTLGPWIDVHVDGAHAERIHTSCSKPIFVGMVQGDFQVLAGSSRSGGVFCAE